MRVLIYEPGSGSGHRFAYVAHVVNALRGLREQGADVELSVAMGPGVRGEASFEHHLGTLAHMLDEGAAELLETTPQAGGRQWSLLGSFAELLGRARPDHVLMPTADGHAQSMGMPGYAARSGISRGRPEIETALHRAAFAYPSASIKTRASRRAALELLKRSPISRLLLVDVVAYRWVAGHCGALASRASMLPDPADAVEVVQRGEARSRLGLPARGRWLVSAGQQNERKGAHFVLRAFALAKREGLLGEDDRLLLAGGCSEGVRAMLASPEHRSLSESGSLVAMDRFLSAAELADSIAAADFVVAAHNGHMGLSNIVLRSVAAHRPVLTSAYGWFEEVVPRFGVGLTVDVSDLPRFARAMGEALSRSDEDWMGSGAAALRRFHSVENFGASITSRLRERLGLDPDPLGMTWEQALAELG